MATTKKSKTDPYRNLKANADAEMIGILGDIDDEQWRSRTLKAAAAEVTVSNDMKINSNHVHDSFRYSIEFRDGAGNVIGGAPQDSGVTAEDLQDWERRLETRQHAIERKEKNIKKWAGIKQIIRAHQIIEELPDGDIVIRIKRKRSKPESITTNRSAHKYAEVEFGVDIEGDE